MFDEAEDLHWIIAEDSDECSPHIADLLARLGIPFTHLTSPQPHIYKESESIQIKWVYSGSLKHGTLK